MADNIGQIVSGGIDLSAYLSEYGYSRYYQIDSTGGTINGDFSGISMVAGVCLYAFNFEPFRYTQTHLPNTSRPSLGILTSYMVAFFVPNINDIRTYYKLCGQGPSYTYMVYRQSTPTNNLRRIIESYTTTSITINSSDNLDEPTSNARSVLYDGPWIIGVK